MFDIQALAQLCAPSVPEKTLISIVAVESSGNPYAIGVVDGELARQPKTLAEAVATATALQQGGWNFSVGLAQLNRYQLPNFGLDLKAAFEPCSNLRVAGLIFGECRARAVAQFNTDEAADRAALSCYYSGNFLAGQQPDESGTSYVARIEAAAENAPAPIGVMKRTGGEHQRQRAGLTLYEGPVVLERGAAVLPSTPAITQEQSEDDAHGLGDGAQTPALPTLVGGGVGKLLAPASKVVF